MDKIFEELITEYLKKFNVLPKFPDTGPITMEVMIEKLKFCIDNNVTLDDLYPSQYEQDKIY